MALFEYEKSNRRRSHESANKHKAKDDTDVLFALVGQMAARLRKTSRKVADLAFLDVAGRVARTLLDLCHEPDAMTNECVSRLIFAHPFDVLGFTFLGLKHRSESWQYHCQNEHYSYVSHKWGC